MGRDPTAVVFDLDYTLAVTNRSRQALLDETTARVGTGDLQRADYLDAHDSVDASETRVPIFERLLPDRDGNRDATAADLAAAYRQAVEDTLEPVAGAADLIRELRESYRVGLLTDGPVAAQRGKLERLGWTDLFDAVVITGDLPAGKPDERAFRAVCDELGVPPERAVYVGDRPEVDVAGAAAVGLSTVQVLYPGGPAPHPAADATVDRADLADALPDVLASL